MAYYEVGAGHYEVGAPVYQIGAPIALRGDALLNQASAMQPRPMGQVQMVQLMPSPVPIRERVPTAARLQPLGCNVETDIAVGATGIATTRPQKAYKPERFTVPPTVAPDFVIASIFIGVALQSPSNTAIAAESFLPDSIYSNVDFDTCEISQELIVNARNRGGAARPFFSTFYGRVLEMR